MLTHMRMMALMQHTRAQNGSSLMLLCCMGVGDSTGSVEDLHSMLLQVRLRGEQLAGTVQRNEKKQRRVKIMKS